jgi:hypothetical protein
LADSFSLGMGCKRKIDRFFFAQREKRARRRQLRRDSAQPAHAGKRQGLASRFLTGHGVHVAVFRKRVPVLPPGRRRTPGRKTLDIISTKQEQCQETGCFIDP